MNTLILLRHAKSSWQDPSLDDFDRPLAKRGRKAAPAVGRYLRTHLPRPDRVICSSSKRTRQTWAAISEFIHPPPEIEITEALYLASGRGIADLIAETKAEVGCLMVIGHNPGMENAALSLIGDGEAKARSDLSQKFPTAAFAEIQFDDSSWRQVGPGRGRLVRFVRPRDL